MKWVQRQSLQQLPYTALVLDDESRELGRYWHRADGFKPATARNNALPRTDELDAREYVLRAVLDRYKREMAELGGLLAANVPRRTLVEHTAPGLNTPNNFLHCPREEEQTKPNEPGPNV